MKSFSFYSKHKEMHTHVCIYFLLIKFMLSFSCVVFWSVCIYLFVFLVCCQHIRWTNNTPLTYAILYRIRNPFKEKYCKEKKIINTCIQQSIFLLINIPNHLAKFFEFSFWYIQPSYLLLLYIVYSEIHIWKLKNTPTNKIKCNENKLPI